MLVSMVSTQSGIITTRNVHFSNEDEEEYRNFFKKIQEDGFIRDDINFDDDIWIVRANDLDYKIDIQINEVAFKKAMRNPNINMEIKDFSLGLKAYVLLTLNYTAPMTIHQRIAFLFKIINAVGFFNFGEVKKFKELITHGNDVLACEGAMELLEFLEIDIPEEYSNAWHDIEDSLDYSSKTRKVPDFKSIFAFGEIVAKFINDASEEEFIKYGVVVLWWYICNNVPMRPTEFILTEKDCIYEQDGEYYLKIKRNIGKGPQHTRKILNQYKAFETYDTDTIKVDKKIFDIVKTYNDLIDKTYPDRDKYLIDKRIYTEQISPYDNGIRYLNKGKFTSRDLRNSLNIFYEEIVSGRYNRKICTKTQKEEDLKIEKIAERKFNDHIEILVPYDIRHIAIMNLIMIGAEPLTVMRLARHKKIRTTQGYYNHVEEYGNSYILTYSKMIKELKTRRTESTSKGNGVNVYEIINNKPYNPALATWNSLSSEKSQNVQYKEVDGGWCKYLKKDFVPCYAVAGNHSRCPYFIPGDNIDIQKEFLEESMNVNGLLETLKELVENHNSITNFSEKYSIAIEEYRVSLNHASDVASKFNDLKTVERILVEGE